MANDIMRAKDRLEDGYDKAEEIIKNKDKMDKFLKRLERKISLLPFLGKKLTMVPSLASLLNKYVRKEYTELPLGSIIAIVSALAYFVSPIDFLPDIFPWLGFLDDAAVVAACVKLVDSDLKEYREWRQENQLEDEQ